MPPLQAYDFALCVTSLYILIPALFCETYTLSLSLLLLACVSVKHWSRFKTGFWQSADRCVGGLVFFTHLWLSRHLKTVQVSVTWAALAFIVFCFRKGMRESLLDKHTLKDTSLRLLPHALFRWFLFWFVMSVHRQWHYWPLTICYWATLFLSVAVVFYG